MEFVKDNGECFSLFYRDIHSDKITYADIKSKFLALEVAFGTVLCLAIKPTARLFYLQMMLKKTATQLELQMDGNIFIPVAEIICLLNIFTSLFSINRYPNMKVRLKFIVLGKNT